MVYIAEDVMDYTGFTTQVGEVKFRRELSCDLWEDRREVLSDLCAEQVNTSTFHIHHLMSELIGKLYICQLVARHISTLLLW